MKESKTFQKCTFFLMIENTSYGRKTVSMENFET